MTDAENRYRAAVAAKEYAEEVAIVAWQAYDTGYTREERVVSCRAWLDAVGAVDIAEFDVAAAWTAWQTP